MVHPALHRVQFGAGDVGVILSVAGTREEPQALMIFENQRPEPIRGLTDDADLSKHRQPYFRPPRIKEGSLRIRRVCLEMSREEERQQI